uniref:NADH-ubiquinone oxidoreductase chain 4L n=1 Tax=Challia fletcheri TaxID=1091408 RepID=J7EVX4_9NEOP|nr:NADH dehydrogenase subunit 4L [Challia fletcheri]AEP83057.1 NADH dehydrogenase subunit 4L [Challia fletcheri]
MMIMPSLMVTSSAILMGLLNTASTRKHLLSTLISIEFTMLNIIMLMILSSNYFNHEIMFSMIMLTLTVCEGALGLSLLISISRSHGNDLFQSFNLL